MKRFVAAPKMVRKRADKLHSRVISQRSLSRIKREAVNNTGITSGVLSRRIEQRTVPRTTRCRLLKLVGKSLRRVTTPQLKKRHVQNRLKLAADNIKVDFSKILFTDESRACIGRFCNVSEYFEYSH